MRPPTVHKSDEELFDGPGGLNKADVTCKDSFKSVAM